MKLKGVDYDAGADMGFNWCPDFDIPTVRREFEIIKNDLHCNAVRVGARDLGRLTAAAQAALEQGLDVWFYPLLWDKRPQETLGYLAKAAVAAEGLRARWPDKVVFVAGGELTLFTKGIVKGKRFTDRISSQTLMPQVRAGEHNKPLNDFLAKANAAVRVVFRGKVSYSSLVWEKVNWDLFDYGVDHYRTTTIEENYIEMLKPSFSYGKPVVVTEFGYATTHGGLGEQGLLTSAGLGGGSIIDVKSQYFHYGLPFIGRFVRPHLNGEHV